MPTTSLSLPLPPPHPTPSSSSSPSPTLLPITASTTSHVASPSSCSLAWSTTTSSSYTKLSLKSSSSSIATMTTVLSAGAHTDMFEHIFRRLEEESAQRAWEEEERERLEAEAEGRPTAQEIADEVLPSANSGTIRSTRERRRTSVSISRYGGPPAPTDGQPTESQPPSTRASRSSSIVVTRPTFYQLDARQSPQSGSADSLASSSVGADPAADVEEVPSVTTQQVWAPKQSLSKAISRRLSRARDVLPLPVNTPHGNGSLVIGVAVEEATIEHRAEEGAVDADTVSTARVYSGTLRSQRSTPGLNEKASTGWVSKAKDITSKFRRKSIAVLNAAPISPR
ncbi:hypothetical protein EIP86_010104 [Pleurotus ostreatoroseus]|nr:hypothetical protein EIP86_010104 [Pleurotus ostreatoroseus]